MKLLVLAGIVFFITSCAAKDDNYYMNTDVIEISNFSLPDSTQVFDTIVIKAEAEAPNACWKNLNIVFARDSDFNYHLRAYGTYFVNGGLCPAQIISTDTVINFQPTQRGKYFVHILKDPQTLIVDTLNVK